MSATENKKRGKQTIVTLGCTQRSFDDLLALLRQSGAQIVADVRSNPNSRQAPEFSQKNLAERLPKLGITYHHLKELGGREREPLERSPNGGLAKPWQGYADYMLSEEFERSLRRLLALAAIGPVALLGAESDPQQCHRRLLADVLTARGLAVTHLDAAGKAVPHDVTPRMVVHDGKVTYPPSGEQMRLF